VEVRNLRKKMVGGKRLEETRKGNKTRLKETRRWKRMRMKIN